MPTSHPVIEARTCSAYDIPIQSKNAGNISANKSNKAEDLDTSSVIDKEEIASRGINHGTSRGQVQDEIKAFLHAPFSLSNEIRSFLTIIMFLTRLPTPVDLHPGFLMKGMAYFPMVGMLIGFMLAVVFDAAVDTLGLPPSVAAALSIGQGFILTGCFHEDGLSDSADGEF